MKSITNYGVKLMLFTLSVSCSNQNTDTNTLLNNTSNSTQSSQKPGTETISELPSHNISPSASVSVSRPNAVAATTKPEASKPNNLNLISTPAPNPAISIPLKKLQAPSKLIVSQLFDKSFKITWDAVDNASSYSIYVNGAFFSVSNDTTFSFSNLTRSTIYKIEVSAVNTTGESSRSQMLEVKTISNAQAQKTLTAPQNIISDSVNSNEFSLNWTSVIGAISYKIYINGEFVAETSSVSYLVANLNSNTNYKVQISAQNTNGESLKSSEINVSTIADDTTTPTPTPTPSNQVSTVAGNGTAGFADGDAANAQFKVPRRIAIDASGNIIIADSANNRIRQLTSSNQVSTIAGNGTAGFADGNALNAQFKYPMGIAIDLSGNIIMSDYINNRIRKVTPSGQVSTIAGNGTADSTDGQGTSARINFSAGVAIDASGNIIIADTNNHKIRKITPSGQVTTIAGNGTEGFADGDAANAQFKYPTDVAIDLSGNIIVADLNNRIRKITPSGQVSTIAGNGTAGFADGNALNAQFNIPQGIAINASGSIFVADTGNNRIRKITL